MINQICIATNLKHKRYAKMLSLTRNTADITLFQISACSILNIYQWILNYSFKVEHNTNQEKLQWIQLGERHAPYQARMCLLIIT